MAARSRPAALSRWLLVVAVGVGIVALVDTTDQLVAPPPFTDGSPDLFIEGGTITTYAESGAVDYRLSATRIEYFRPEDVSYLDAPELVVFNDTEHPWVIAAESGQGRALSGRASTLELKNNVAARQERDDGTFTRLSSEAVTVFPDRRVATSEAPVMIETHAYTLRAVGFESNLANGRIKLGSSKEQRGELRVFARNG